MIFHLSAFSLFAAIILVIIYYRHRVFALLAPVLPSSLVARLSNYTPLASYSFSDQAAAGITSSNFDLEENLGEGSGENRMGLDERGVEEVRRIMAIEKCSFDRARLIRQNRLLAANGIAPDGTPLDRKAITRL